MSRTAPRWRQADRGEFVRDHVDHFVQARGSDGRKGETDVGARGLHADDGDVGGGGVEQPQERQHVLQAERVRAIEAEEELLNRIAAIQAAAEILNAAMSFPTAIVTHS
jgi:hypothetical protein